MCRLPNSAFAFFALLAPQSFCYRPLFLRVIDHRPPPPLKKRKTFSIQNFVHKFSKFLCTAFWTRNAIIIKTRFQVFMLSCSKYQDNSTPFSPKKKLTTCKLWLPLLPRLEVDTQPNPSPPPPLLQRVQVRPESTLCLVIGLVLDVIG